LVKSGDLSNLLLSENNSKPRELLFYKINRGGDITYHGPGQIVVTDNRLDNFFTDIHKYLRFLEAIILITRIRFRMWA
jgi:lipoyl(octanoyl) transferase